MKRGLAGVAILALLLAGGWLLWGVALGPDRAAPRDVEVLTAPPPGAPGLASAARTPDPASIPVAETPPPAPAVRHLLTLRLAPADGEILPGVSSVVTRPIRDMRPGERWDGLDFKVRSTAETWPHEADISTLFAEHAHPMIELEVAVDHPAYLPARQRVKRASGAAAVDGGLVHYDVTLRVREAAVLEGRVLDEAGAPVQGAQVGAWPPLRRSGYGSPVSSASTDADGSYRLRTPGGLDYAVVAAKEGLAPDRADVRVERAGRASVEDLTLRVGRSLAGVVLLNERPLCGAAIRVRRVERGEDWRKVFKGWPAAEVPFEIETWAGPLRRPHPGQLAVQETAEDLALAQGAAVSDSEGRFRVAGLVAGTHAITLDPWIRSGFMHPGLLASMRRRVEAPNETITLRIAASIVRFRVLSGDKPIAAASVRVTIDGKQHGLSEEALTELVKEVQADEIASLGEHRTTLRTRDDGWTQPVLVPPDCELGLSISGEGSATRREVLFAKPAGVALDHAVQLEPSPEAPESPPAVIPGSLIVEVTAPDGVMIPRCAVGLYRPGRRGPSPESRRRVSSNDNSFRIDDVPPGTWRIVVRPGGTWAGAEAFWLDAEATVGVRSGEVSRVSLETRRGGRLRLTARDAVGRETNAVCRILDAEGSALSVGYVCRQSGSHGLSSTGLAIPGPIEVAQVLAPGRYTVECRPVLPKPEGAWPVRREIEVRAGAVIDLDLELPDR